MAFSKALRLVDVALVVVSAALATTAACAAPSAPPASPAPAASSVASSVASSAPAPACAPHTVILVRHAEKGEGKDPALTPQGQARAAKLADLLARTKVTRLVASEFRRTQDTLAPLAAKLQQKVEVKPAGEADALASELRAAPEGSVTVVATHSNVLPALVKKLGGRALEGVPEGAEALADTDYDRLVVLTLSSSSPSSPSAAACGGTAMLELKQPSP